MGHGATQLRDWLIRLAVAVLIAVGLLAVAGDRVRGLLAESLLLGAMAAAIATPLGALLAVLLSKTDTPGRRVAWLVLGGLMMAPLYLHAAAWQAGFGLLGWATQAAAGDGPIDPLLAGLPGAAWVHAMSAVPWVTLIVAAALTSVSPEHEESAALETSPAGVLRRVTLRRAAAGALLAALWVAVICASEMTVTDLFNVRTFAEEVYTQATLGMLNSGEGEAPLGLAGWLAGTLLLVLVAAVVMAIGTTMLVEPNDRESGRGWLWRLASRKWLGTVAVAALLLLVGGLPIANLGYKAGVEVQESEDGRLRQWSATKMVRMVARAPWEHRRELWHSLQLGVAVATTATVGGVAIAWGLCRGGRTRSLLLPLIAAGLVVPGPVLGVATIRLLNQPLDSPLAGLTWFYDHTLLAPWLAQTIRVTPLAALVVWSALASVPRELLDAAASEGTSRWASLWRVALPMRWPAVAAAWIVGLAMSVGELAATVLVLPPGPQTVTVRIFSLLHYGVEDRVAALSLLMMGGYLLLGGVVVGALARNSRNARPADFPR